MLSLPSRLPAAFSSALFGIALLAAPSTGQTKLLRFPDIRGDVVAFCYAGDLWAAPAGGGTASRLTAHEGLELFPKFSPDGQWIAFISFPKEIDPADHPYYKRVYLRLMPASGGTPKVIAYVYGGQGTINVPSWSPDSRMLAFVSNSSQ